MKENVKETKITNETKEVLAEKESVETFESFQQKLKDAVRKKLDDKIKVEVTDVVKNNGVTLRGMTFSGMGDGISPTIYLESYFEAFNHGYDLDELSDKIIDLFRFGAKKDFFDVQEFLDFECAKNHIAYKLVNYNKNEELLKKIPHRKFLDMAIVYYFLLDTKEGDMENATILIYNNHLENWGVSVEELDQIAAKNTPVLLKEDLRNILEVIEGLLHQEREEEEEDGDYGMYVLSNKSKIFGAAAILYSNVLKSFAQKVDSDLYIIPSSVHEVILVPKKDGMSWEPLLQMVKEVNATQVEDVEILADNLYYYSREKDEVCEACEVA